jgi:hypothetical protein
VRRIRFCASPVARRVRMSLIVSVEPREMIPNLDAAAARERGAMKIKIVIPDDVAMHLNAFLQRAALYDDQPTSHGKLTVESLAEMLMEDVALAIRRPGSWEGANMSRVLESHGYCW